MHPEIQTHDKLETGSFYSNVCVVTNFITMLEILVGTI